MFDKRKFLKKWMAIALTGIVLFVFCWSNPAKASETPERYAYFGDLHVHTNYSLDSYLGMNPNGPREAYRFAQGEEVPTATGELHQLKTPLDFTAITDHAEFLGEVGVCNIPDSPTYDKEDCKLLREALDNEEAAVLAYEIFVLEGEALDVCGENGELCDEYTSKLWQKIQDAATEFNQPGQFTTLKAYEWTSYGEAPRESGAGIHRNIIFRNDTVPETVFSELDSPNPEDLWAWLDANCTGECEAIVIPHNTNLSYGTAFTPYYFDLELERPIDAERARTQQRLERLVEVIQTKGESECRPGLGNTDELCGFEKLDRRPIAEDTSSILMEGAAVISLSSVPPCTEFNEVDESCVSKYSYIREGLKEGIKQEAKLGVNPFKYGFVGATDTHNGMPASGEENNFKGSHGFSDATPEYRLGTEENPLGDHINNLLTNPGGVTGVWAEENSRDSIFDALKRRETFATSGPRIQVRLFGGYEFPDDLDELPDAISIAYSTGVPMGSDLATPPAADTAPEMFVWAMQDPKSAKLHAIQIIKGWLDENGESQEKVYAVACSDGLQPREDGLCPLNKATVDITTCAISQDPFVPGAAELSAVWRDPDFDPNQHAFYYARVIENPTCRWSTYDAITLGIDPPDGVNPFIRERAWSSPIWYSPSPEPDEDMSNSEFWDRIIQEVIGR